MTKLQLINISLGLFATYHLCVGIPSVLSFDWLQKVGSFLYSLKIPSRPDAQFEYVLKPLGLYALFVSFVSYYLLNFGPDDMKRHFLLTCAFLLIGRAMSRLYYSPLFLKAFGTTPARNRGHALFNIAVGGIFILLSWS